MIKFFRSIRQRLLRENRFTRYLIYSIGEIILVVIGILIALQINNWNDNEKLSRLEIKLLKVMQKNLKADISDMNFNKEYYGNRLRANQTVLNAFEHPDNIPDTLSFSYANLGTNPYFIENTSAYDNLKSTGFDLIVNDSLREQIMELYGATYQWIGDLEDDHSRFYSDKLETLLMENFETKEPFVSASPVVNPSELANNHKLKEALRYNSGWIVFILARYDEARNAAESLDKNIQKEIEKRD